MDEVSERLQAAGGPPKLRLDGASDFFHHKRSVGAITDTQPVTRDNSGLIGAVRSVPVSEGGHRIRQNPILGAL